jgi:kynurenine formamidase
VGSASQSHESGATSVSEVLRGAPSNWGKWGPDDEVGGLNYLDAGQAVVAAGLVRSGKSFTLQLPMANPGGEPVWPGRQPALRFMAFDKSDYDAGTAPVVPGGLEYADDYLTCFLQGSTQCDALSHMWFDDTCWNGYSAYLTVGRLKKASVAPLAQHGIVGSAVLLDFPRHWNVEALEPGRPIYFSDVINCAQAQGVTIEKRDVLIVRTGWLQRFFRMDAAEFYADYNEPGLAYSLELVKFFQDMEIPVLVTDTLANEVTRDPSTGFSCTLHGALMRNLGVVFTEAADLENLAADCAVDRQYRFMYVAAPLNVTGAAGSPVNPVVIK